MIAFRGGKWRNALLLLVIVPFFVTYLIRTLSWETILSDSGIVVEHAEDGRDRLRRTGACSTRRSPVVAGITYNFLPFMILPLYAAPGADRPRLLEAGYDLYGRRRDVFLRVTLPLSMPGVVAGTLLTFIPAAGDFINAELLGTPKQFMIGNVIQSRYLEVATTRPPAALSFLLMAFMLIIVLIWARIGRGGDRGAAAARDRRARSRDDRGAAAARQVLDWLLNVYAGAGAALPAGADRGHPRLLVQQPGRPLQLHLAGVLARRLEGPVRGPGHRRRALTSIEIAALSTVVATDPRHAHRAGARALRVQGPRAGQLLHLHPARHARGRAGRGAAVAVPQLGSPQLGFATILIAHIMFNLSFVIITVRSRLIGFDRSLEEAAQDLGATPWETFRLVTLPLIMPGVISAGLLAFALSIDDFVITNFNAGSTITFPLFIWGAARVAIQPQIYVIASMIFLFTVAMMLLTVWQQRRAEEDGGGPPRARGGLDGGSATPAPNAASTG